MDRLDEIDRAVVDAIHSVVGNPCTAEDAALVMAILRRIIRSYEYHIDAEIVAAINRRPIQPPIE
jgi:hypothetical protein